MPRISPPALLALPSAVVAVVVGLILAVVGLPLWLVLVAAVLVGAAAGAAVWYRSPGVALRQLGAAPLDPSAEPRLANVVEGLCVTHGHREPKLHVVESDAPNAAVVGRASGDAHLVVTRGMLDSFDRLELEAVVARELSQMKIGIEAATVLVSVADMAAALGLRDRLLDWALDRDSVMAIDLEGVRLTRYPPALASAYEKAARSQLADSSPAADHLWLLGTGQGTARPTARPSVSDRIDVLREL